MKSQGASNSILKKSTSDFINIDDEEVIDFDESNASSDIIDSNNADDDEDEFDCGGASEDPIGNFSDINPDCFSEIDQGTKLDIYEQQEYSFSSKTELFNGEMVENANGSEISEVSQLEKFSSHTYNKTECSSDDSNESDACKDLQCRSVEGETHTLTSDSESDSSVELTRPTFR